MDNKNELCREGDEKRPRYYKRQLLSAEQLSSEQAYQDTSLRRLILGLAGTGVVYGYQVDPKKAKKKQRRKGCIYIGCGLAFDRHGRQLHTKDTWISVKDLAGPRPERPGWYTLRAHYAERRLGPERQHWCEEQDVHWVCEEVVYSLVPRCKGVRHTCPDHCDECISLNQYTCRRLGAVEEDVIPPFEDLRGLCDDPERLCPVDCDSNLNYDPDSPVPIACVKICDISPEGEDCEPEYGFCYKRAKVCRHRKYVYRNDYLHELIRGCHIDLARVWWLSWRRWLVGRRDEVSWDDFRELFDPDHHLGLQIRFSKPVRIKTLHRASVLLQAVRQERFADYWEARRIPIRKIEALDVDEHKCTRTIRLHIEKEWLNNEIFSRRSTLEEGAYIELIIRGSLVRDKCRSMLDGRPMDIRKRKPGQAMPGDDFLAVFKLASRCEADDPDYESYPSKREKSDTNKLA